MDSKKINLDLEMVEQVADMLWLSSYIANSKIEVKPQKPKSIDDNSASNEPREKIKNPKKSKKEKKSFPEKKKASSVYDNRACDTKTDIKADPIRMPKKLSLSNYRAWEKSFRLFYHKVDSRDEFVLDEVETVDIIAKTKLVQPIFKAKKIKYFQLIMVIEQSPSMDIWKELLLEFQRTIQRFGVFENIQFYYLASDKEGVRLYRDRALHKEINYKKLNFNKGTVLTVVSDCISSAWHSNHIFIMLAFWSKTVPVSITQMFPKRMWQGTSLYKGFQTSFTAQTFQALNKQLKSDEDYYDEEDDVFNIPVINFEPQSIEAWASVLQGKRDKWIDGVILEDLKEEKFVEMGVNKKVIPSKERVDRYLSQASPLAQELALYASVLPISFHVVRVLQELKLPKSNQIHLAEFFLGGLIKRELNDEGKVSFDFHDGVRDYFRKQLTATASYRLQELMSSFVSKNLNSSLDFQALINNPNSTSGLFLSKDEVAFVKLRADTLRRLGGDYGRQADELLEKVVLGGEESLVRDIKSEFLEGFMPLPKLVDKEIEVYSRIFNYSFGLSARLARSFSEKHSREVINLAMNDIKETYGEIGWIKKLENNKILWVDDKPRNNEEVVNRFEKIGLVVDIAKSMNEGLELIQQNRYLVILSDMERREGTDEGYVLLDKLRAFDKDTPFIFFTSHSNFSKNRKMTLERGEQGATDNPDRLCRMVMDIVEDGKLEEKVINHSVVLIQSKINKNFGTGFSIYKDEGGSYILTTIQILESLATEQIIINNIKIEDFAVSIYSMGSTGVTDLVILYVKGLFLTPLELETNSLISREVYTVGYNNYRNEEYRQNSVDGKILGDKVSVVSREGVGKNLNLWKINEGISSGSRGAPLISKESRKVIGIVSHRVNNKSFYSISIDYLKNRIDEKSILPFQNLIPLELKKPNLYFINKQKADAVVLIKSNENRNLGTGFVIYQDKGGSYIVTTEHIVDYTLNPIVNGYENVEIINIDKRLNLAILYVQGLYSEVLELQDKDFVNRGVELLGYSRFTNLENRKEIMEAKIVSNFLNITDEDGSIYTAWKIIAYDGYEFDRASSGAPIISKESGMLIGIFSNKGRANEGYVTSIQYLQNLIDNNFSLPLSNVNKFDLEVNDSFFNKGHMNKSVVLISSQDSNNKSFGTGFIIQQDGSGCYIVTAANVIESIKEVRINHNYSTEVIRLNKLIDLAILYVRDFYEEALLLQNEDFESREVELMGYSIFLQNIHRKESIPAKIVSDSLMITDGTKNKYKAWEVLVEDNYSLERGMGGSPIISSESQRVIGILINKKGSNIGYVISIEYLKEVWNEK